MQYSRPNCEATNGREKTGLFSLGYEVRLHCSNQSNFATLKGSGKGKTHHGYTNIFLSEITRMENIFSSQALHLFIYF